MILNIKKPNDLIKIRNAILENLDFTLGEITPLTFKITIDGGRFVDYDINYIDSDIAKIVLSYQQNYTKLLNELEKKFKIKFDEKDKILKFKLEKGSLEFISELLNLEVLKNMESRDKLLAIIGLALIWFSYQGYVENLEQEIKLADIKKQEVVRQLEGEEKEKYLKTIDNTIDTFKELMLDKKIQDSINTPKKEVLSLLKENEVLEIDNKELSNTHKENFEYKKPSIEDIDEEPVIEDYYVESYNFYKEGKMFKLVGLSTEVISETLDANKRMQLINKAHNKELAKVKLKYIKDGITKKIKKVYLQDLLN